jgi:hypothetical protein
MKLSTTVTAALLAFPLALAPVCSAQDAGRETERPAANETVIARPPDAKAGPAPRLAIPSAPPPEAAPWLASAPARGRSRDRDSAGEAAFQGLVAREVKAGQARVAWNGGDRIVRPGDVLGTDRVRSIEPGRIVLERGSSAGSGDLVVLRLDALGHARVRVYSVADPAVPAPVVR